MRLRPKVSTLVTGALALAMALLLVAAVLLDRTTEPVGRTVVTMRLWDEQVAAAYRESFDEFTRIHPDIDVQLNVVPFASYFNTLRTDAAGGSADDIFWLSNAYFAGYADSGRLLDIAKMLGPNAATDWETTVVDQFTPQRCAVGGAAADRCRHRRLLQRRPHRAGRRRSAPTPGHAVVARRCRHPAVPACPADRRRRRTSSRRTRLRPGRIRQWGYNAANDLQGIYLNYIGSAGGTFSDGDRFAFDNPRSVAAFDYLARLINDDHVAPPASDTNGNGDFSRNQFLQGRMALFQSGTYNLAAIAEDSRFRWGVVPMPVGPVGRVSVTNGIAAAGNSATKHPDAVRQLLAWMGSVRGNQYLGARGAAIPAVLPAQRAYLDYWAGRGVDVGPFFSVLDGPRIPAPGGPGFPAGYEALQPYFDEIFLGRADVATTLGNAQAAANAAAER